VTAWGLDGGGWWKVMPMAGAVTTAAAEDSVAPEVSHSTTNVQEAGVDELDLVKTDGGQDHRPRPRQALCG
jgi:uncharacterized secreted protein with C-terminal beta-propeller domain